MIGKTPESLIVGFPARLIIYQDQVKAGQRER